MDKFITYQLHILIKKPVQVKIGKLGTFDFPVGKYIYTGSAKRNIEARIKRHLVKSKKLRWHIDYLLNAPYVTVEEVKKFKASECQMNQKIKGAIVVKKFGASDCIAGCGSHLKYE